VRRGGRRFLSLLRLPAAGALILATVPAAAWAEDLTIVSTGDEAASAKVELIGASRLGCNASLTSTSGLSSQCAFDTATKGARITARQEAGSSSLEAYATIAATSEGAFTPDQLLTPSVHRSSEATSLALVGMKGSAFNDRLKMTVELARTERVVDQLIDQDGIIDQKRVFQHLVGVNPTVADQDKIVGTSASIRFDAKLIDRQGLKWSLSGLYQSASDDFSVGRSQALAFSSAMPGKRMSISTKAGLGQFSISAGLEQSSTPFGNSSSRRAGFDMDGLSLSVISRDSSARPIEGSSLLDSRTKMTSAYVDIDPELLAGSLFPDVIDLPKVVPSTVSLSYRSGSMDNHYAGSDDRYAKSSLGVDASWDTPLGETSLSYWRDSRTALSAGTQTSTEETLDVSHSVRRGHWRFGLDASLTRAGGGGAAGYRDRSLSFGQSVSYSATGGPEFRLQLGQDRGSEQFGDLSYASTDRFSSITASLDLSHYLQKRFERPDLHLTLDYRKTVDRSNGQMSLYDELVEQWLDRNRREGFLMSFGMNL